MQSPVTTHSDTSAQIRDSADAAPKPANATTFRERHGRNLRVLLLSAPFPSGVEPGYGVFVKQRARAIADLPGIEFCVVSPIPYFPPLKIVRKWHAWSQFPREEVVEGIPVARVRYPLLPKVGAYVHPQLMLPFVKRRVDEVRCEFDFDLIDSHFVFPSGVVGAKLGQIYGKPVVMTGRGEDMLSFPNLPLMGSMIRGALPRADRLIAVSQQIANAMTACGADPAKIEVIPNGTDARKFYPGDRDDARRRLGINHEGPLIVSVGDRRIDKGFDILIEAFARIRPRFPACKLAIVGGPARTGVDHTPVMEELINRHNLRDHVYLPGRCEHAGLRLWYCAADLFASVSGREGSSNALLEALACGTPSIVSRVGESTELMQNPDLGLLIDERTPDAAASSLSRALERTWDRAAVHAGVADRTWALVADKCMAVFESVMSEFEAGSACGGSPPTAGSSLHRG